MDTHTHLDYIIYTQRSLWASIRIYLNISKTNNSKEDACLKDALCFLIKISNFIDFELFKVFSSRETVFSLSSGFCLGLFFKLGSENFNVITQIFHQSFGKIETFLNKIYSVFNLFLLVLFWFFN